MKLNFSCPINDLGYGVAGTNLLRGLAASHEVSLFPIGQTRLAEADQATYDQCIKNAARYDDAAPSVRIYHQNDLAQHVGRGIRVGFPFFELVPLTDDEVFQANRMDLYLVASQWAEQVAKESGVTTPIAVVPLGVDQDIFKPSPTGLEHTVWAETTIFFNVGKWEIRKGHDVLLSAFNRAFEPSDNVMLRMCCYNPFLGEANEQWRRSYLTSKMGAAGKIDVLKHRLQSQQEVALFMNCGDVGVFPARAEGWNLDLLEAMSLGKQVIATYYSGHTEFVDPLNNNFIFVDRMESAQDGVWFHGQGQWAELGTPQEDQLIEHMRALHRQKQTGDNMVNQAGISTAERYSWANAAASLVDALR